jgi:hypothetical protein
VMESKFHENIRALEDMKFEPRQEQLGMVMGVMTMMNQICVRCNCCIARGTDPQVCYTSCCFDRSSCTGSRCALSGVESCGCDRCNSAIGMK